MTMFDREEFDRVQFDELLDQYLDGDLPADAVQRFESFAASDADAAGELRLARLVQQRLGSLPQPSCPAEVTRSVLAEARADARRSFAERRRSFAQRLRMAAASSWSTIVGPSLAVGIFAAVIVGGALIGRQDTGEQVDAVAAHEASPQDIERSLNDAKWALAYVSGVGRRTATTIRDDVLDEHVVRPVNRALSAAFDDEPDIR